MITYPLFFEERPR